jgi:hypothetical protein
LVKKLREVRVLESAGSTTTLTPPQADKWRIEHPEVLDLPIEDMRRRLGYLGPLATPECD